MKSLEHEEQVNLMKWWSMACHGYGIPETLLFAIPNGGQRNIIVASKLKDEGVRSGVPDLFLAHPGCHGAHGLFIEMKKSVGGRLSSNQSIMLGNLANAGFHCAVCHGWIEAKAAILNYINGKFESLYGPQIAHLN